MGSKPGPAFLPSPAGKSGRLDSWKEIATYLNRQVRTVNLWEKTEGLPVHRHVHARRGTVYAFKAELDDWRQQRANVPEAVTVPQRAQRAHQAKTMLAVLPFENLSGDDSQGYFSDGLTEEMISQLGRLSPPQLGVIARTSAMHYKNSRKSVAEIGVELGVTYVLEGSVRRSRERLRITAQLVHVADQLNVWSQSYDRELSDVLVLQTEVAARIAESLLIELNWAQPVKRTPAPAITSGDAFESYLKARHYLNQRSETSLLKAVHYFTCAVTKDPELAVGYCGLGDAYNLLAVYGVLPPQEAMPLAESAALRALTINPELGEAHACLGEVRSFYEWKWHVANKEYELAIALNPSYPTAHHYYGYFLSANRQHERALSEIALAENYDPHSTIIGVWKGILLSLSGNYRAAAAACLKSLEQDADFALAHWALGLAYQQLNLPDAALQALEMAAALSGRSPGMLAAIGHLQAVSGDSYRAKETLRQLRVMSAKRYVPAYDLAIVYTGLGEIQAALELFEKAFDERSTWLATLPMDPRVARLRYNRDFQFLLDRLELPGDRLAS